MRSPWTMVWTLAQKLAEKCTGGSLTRTTMAPHPDLHCQRCNKLGTNAVPSQVCLQHEHAHKQKEDPSRIHLPKYISQDKEEYKEYNRDERPSPAPPCQILDWRYFMVPENLHGPSIKMGTKIFKTREGNSKKRKFKCKFKIKKTTSKYEENVVTSFKLNLLLMIIWFYIINYNS